MRSFQLMCGAPVSMCFMVMQFSTGHTSAQRLQPTHSSSMIRGTCTSMPLGFFLPFAVRRAAIVRSDGLVRAVFAGDVAELAADAQLGINLGDDFVIQVEVAPVLHVGYGAAAKIFDGAEAVRVHVLRKAVDHVFDDAEAVVHRGGADLHGGSADSDVLRGVVPIADAANAADGNLHRFRHRRNQMQRDGLHRRAAIAAVRGFAAHVGARRKRFQIDADQRVDRVDQADGVRAAAFGGCGDARNVRDVGRELHDHRNFRHFLHPGSDHLRVFGHLADRRAHAALAHAVRAAEIQFERVGAGVFGAAHHVVPGSRASIRPSAKRSPDFSDSASSLRRFRGNSLRWGGR